MSSLLLWGICSKVVKRVNNCIRKSEIFHKQKYPDSAKSLMIIENMYSTHTFSNKSANNFYNGNDDIPSQKRGLLKS